MTPGSAKIADRIPALDGLRGLAALMVIVVHLWTDGFLSACNMPRKVELLLGLGTTGVDLFFVLSGFLITRILLATRGTQGYFGKFYIRRTLRIFPLYYLALCLSYFVFPALYSESTPPVSKQWWYWFYLQNIPSTFHWLQASGPEHFWSLAVEEHFYLVWPALVFLCPPKKLPLLSLAIVVSAIACRIGMFSAGYNVYFLTPCRMDALAMGALLAAIEPSLHSRPKLAATLLAVSGAVFLALVVAFPFTAGSNGAVLQALKYTAEAFVFLGLMTFLVAFPESWASRFFACGPMAAMGTISYGLYVYHPYCLRIVQSGAYGGVDLAHAAIGVGLTFAVATVSYVAFESPILKLKRYFPYSGSKRQRR